MPESGPFLLASLRHMASRLPPRLAAHARYFSHNAAVRVAAGASPALPAAPTSRTRSLFASSALLATGLLSGIALVLLAPRPKSIALIFPVPTAVAPGAETAEGRKWTAEIERGLQELKVVKELRGKMEKVDGQEGEVRSWTESRPYATSVPGPHSLSASTYVPRRARPDLVLILAQPSRARQVRHSPTGIHQRRSDGGDLCPSSRYFALRSRGDNSRWSPGYDP